MKNIAMQEFRDEYARLKTSWGGYSGYDSWVANANNAAFGAQAAYDELVPGFEALFEARFERSGTPEQQWQRFYDEVKRLADLPPAKRAAALKPS